MTAPWQMKLVPSLSVRYMCSTPRTLSHRYTRLLHLLWSRLCTLELSMHTFLAQPSCSDLQDCRRAVVDSFASCGRAREWSAVYVASHICSGEVMDVVFSHCADMNLLLDIAFNMPKAHRQPSKAAAPSTANTAHRPGRKLSRARSGRG